MEKSPTWNLKDLLSAPVRDLDVLRKEVDDQVQRFEGLRERLSPEMPAETFL